MPRPYQMLGLTLAQGGSNNRELVRALQRDLRALGYLGGGLDGDFGRLTTASVRALQYDLTHPAVELGAVNINNYSTPKVAACPSGQVNEDLAACIDTMLADSNYATVPEANDAVAARSANAAALAAVAAITTATAPPPFMLAMFRQESDCCHYHIPTPSNPDAFVSIGLDRNDPNHPDHITSRGWGLGQFTIEHHPPTQAEMRDFVLDPVGNVHKAFAELRNKFDQFVAGHTSGTRADDRSADHPMLNNLRLCRYAPNDQRYLHDCQACAMATSKIDIHQGTPFYHGAADTYQPTQYYPSSDYLGVPNRADFLCDWPYAARRYNGSGVNSYHYQARILRNLLSPS